MEVIVTGGAGYIGSTICSALQDRGHTPIILDSLVTGYSAFAERHEFIHADIANFSALQQIKKRYPKCDTLIHCAARIVVSESTVDPLLYYRENVGKSIELFDHCLRLGIHRILFSSSASVYGHTQVPSVDENHPCKPMSPYAETKLITEKILKDLSNSSCVQAISLRYFNPIGADPQMRTGPFIENPSHLLGRLMNTMKSNEKRFEIYGEDWPTRDGTCIRDFIHVWDLAQAHVDVVEYLAQMPLGKPWNEVFNIGTGEGTTVKEFVQLFQKVTGQIQDICIGLARPGDVVGSFACANKIRKLLGWKARYSIEEGIASALSWRDLFTNSKYYPETFLKASAPSRKTQLSRQTRLDP